MQIKRIGLGGIIMTVIMFSGCSTTVQNLAIGEEKTLETGKTEQESVTEKDINMNEKESFNAESNINDVIHDSAFDDYGRLIFPVDVEIEDNLKLKDVSSILPWYSEVNTDKTGLFFFRGNAGAKTTIINAGGCFVYVAGIESIY